MSVDKHNSPGTSDHSICFDQDLIERHGGRGPRYTSYPTAVQFEESFTANDYARHARNSNEVGRPLSLYVHIPFCKTLCYYCACNKIVTRNAERVESYLEHIYQEINMQSELFDRARPVTQLHFGGGTPTYLDSAQMCSLFEHLHRAFTFDDSDAREFSIEVDPRTVNSDSMALLTKLGFNRVSLGVQDFDLQVQTAVNRVQSADAIVRLMDDARRNKFKSISFDLIYGLPLQNVATFDRTLDQVLEMRPDRLAIYNYAHLPTRFKGQRMINDGDIPLPATKLDILRHTIEKLGNSDYVYIGMDHFAVPDDDLVIARENGTLQRNFQGYSTHGECDLIGLGVSAISSIGNAYSQNSTSTREYEQLVSGGSLPVQRGIEIDRDDTLRGEVIQQLMCYDHLIFSDFDQEHDIDFRSYFLRDLKKLQPLMQDGLVQLDDEQISITAKGRLLLRSIAMVFDRYLNTDDNGDLFSKAI